MTSRFEVQLRQYTPLLHFQGEQEGACLRASEVKPALDNFITDWLNKQKIDVRSDAGKWIYPVDDDEKHIAYRYRMTFRADETQKDLLDVRKNPIKKLYFAAMGKAADSNHTKGVFYRNGMTMTILIPGDFCLQKGNFNMKLSDVISTLLPPFFALHCFGNRSNKGFGSFGVTRIGDMPKDSMTPRQLAEYAPNQKTLYYVDYETFNCSDRSFWKKYLDDVFTLSQIIKAGLNYTRGDRSDPRSFEGLIFKYFREECGGIYSEKRFIKNGFPKEGEKKYSFVRALIGLPQLYEYKTFKVKIDYDEDEPKKKIIRYENPIHFKLYDKYLLIVPQIIPSLMFDRTFNLNSQKLTTPDNNTFELLAFLDYCQSIYSQEHDDLSDRFDPEKDYFKNHCPEISLEWSKPIYYSLKRIESIQKEAGELHNG
jgi:hypothetical protein